jgi:hypothetical protein
MRRMGQTPQSHQRVQLSLTKSPHLLLDLPPLRELIRRGRQARIGSARGLPDATSGQSGYTHRNGLELGAVGGRRAEHDLSIATESFASAVATFDLASPVRLTTDAGWMSLEGKRDRLASHGSACTECRKSAGTTIDVSLLS